MNHIGLSDRQRKAVQVECRTLLNGWHINDIDTVELHTMEWRQLNDMQSDLLKHARAVIDRMDDSQPIERRSLLDDAHAGLLLMHDAISGEKDARAEIGSRGPREPISARRPVGVSSSEPRERNYSLAKEQRFSEHELVMRSDPKFDQVPVGRFLRAICHPDNDRELRSLVEGTNTAGGYTVPAVLSARMIDNLRAKTVAIQAGARTVPLTSDVNYIAKVTADPVPSWRAESASVGTGDPTFSRITFQPKSLAVLCLISRELFEDTLNLDQVLPDIIAKSMALEVDRAALFGSGSSNQPLGVVNASGINSVAYASSIYDSMLHARTAVLQHNAPDVTAFIMNPRDEGALTRLKDSQGRYLDPPAALAKTPLLTTNSVPITGGGGSDGEILGGYWPNLLLGFRNELRIEVLRERYADTMQFAFLAHLRMDVATEHDESFVKITGVPGSL